MRGRLRLAANRRTWLLERADGKGSLQLPRGELSVSLANLDAKTHEGVEVEFELVGGQPRKIRLPGEVWAAAAAARPAARQDRAGQGRPERARPTQPPRVAPEFHNPYNFVPAPPREVDDPDLGDCGRSGPAGHARYMDGRWSGYLRVRMEVKTPLLLPDASRAEKDRESGHTTYPVRRGPDGAPYIPPTSVKGMLRAAYEAATNSRLGVFVGHGSPLAYRMDASEGLKLVPARIESKGGVLQIRLMPGPRGPQTIGADGRPTTPPNGVATMYAAWLPRYHGYNSRSRPAPDKGESAAALRYPNGRLPEHGDRVWVQVRKVRHANRPFEYMEVSHIDRRQPNQTPPQGMYTGWVCVTGRNIMRKHHERVFLEFPSDVHCPLTEEFKTRWEQLINNYREIHKDDIAARRAQRNRPDDYLGHEPGRTGWSLHVWNPAAGELRDGTLCYARVERQGGQLRVLGLYPVMISRGLFGVSPETLLDPTVRPARSMSELSPADRVFGWVNQSGRGAYRGNLRIGPVRCESPDPIEPFDPPGLPLAILGQPKPQQARFYVARDATGRAQSNGLSKRDVGYMPGRGLRGRKVYPHHAALPTGHWDNPLEDRTQQSVGGVFQEYRRPRQADGSERDSQNRSVLGWVKQGTVFRFDIYVANLSDVELGALLWLVSLPGGHVHRLGGGKPLGFGSVRLDIEAIDVRTGEGWRRYYAALDEDPPAPEYCLRVPGDADRCVVKFKEAVGRAYGNGRFEGASFIRAFLRASEGFGDRLPTHYPRARPADKAGPVPPHREGRAYEWFVANERLDRGNPIYGYSLPDLDADNGLPVLPQT